MRAELYVFIPRMTGRNSDEVRYVVDPGDVKGPEYPTETFRGLK